ncbi:hypothetical protein [Oceanicoccus sagamiensis]|uniref:STAS/SEC14 domain-containing protein n=1 Tax=Oceanicoccus sagamiensis TaxID=716816 RepID=A0A1X9N7L1_9GAMM|nr:hypothetical protein [Oceanicoccus sagamiensis]ARN73676.1 hypothetical protein BST96_05815 [Oceanicoccus sagamiensis]
MPVSFNWEDKKQLYISYTGTITGQEVLESQSAITDNYPFEDLRGIVLDVSQVKENLCVESDVVKVSAVAQAQAKTNPKIKNAIVLGANEESQAFTAYYQLLAESTGWDIEMFSSEQDARDWLG